MRVLVTGGCGLVGRHLVRALLARGDEVVVVDSLLESGGGQHPAKWLDNLENLRFYEIDCRIYFPRWGMEGSFDLVLHCAAVVGGRRTIDGSPMDVADCLSIDVAMFQWAMRARPGRVVYFSSSAAYPVWMQADAESIGGGGRLEESDIDHHAMALGVPDQTYGWAKLTGEQLAIVAIDAGVPVTIYRPFSGYAEDQGPEYPMTAICQRAVEAARAGEEKITVWGSGKQVRDWIHMSDVVRMVLETCMDLPTGTCLNLCTGEGTSMIEVAREAMLVAARAVYRPLLPSDVRVEPMADQPSGVMHRVGDPTRLHQHTAPATVSVAEGISRVVRRINGGDSL